jgi:hypothetical protein
MIWVSQTVIAFQRETIFSFINQTLACQQTKDGISIGTRRPGHLFVSAFKINK